MADDTSQTPEKTGCGVPAAIGVGLIIVFIFAVASGGPAGFIFIAFFGPVFAIGIVACLVWGVVILVRSDREEDNQ